MKRFADRKEEIVSMKPKLMGLGTRILAGLAFGTVAGLLIRHSGLGAIFLVALCIGTAVLSVGLGGSRLLVAGAIWLGQYLVFYWRFMRPVVPSVEVAAPLFIINGMVIFVPGLAVTMGAFVGLLAERIRGGRKHQSDA